MSALVRWLEDRRVDFGVMDVAEGGRPEVVRADQALQRAADVRLRELQDQFLLSVSSPQSP